LLTINNFGLGNTLVFGSDLTSTINNSSFFTFTNGGIASSSWNGSTFTITAIPEPSTYVAAIGLLALMLWPLRAGCAGSSLGLLGSGPLASCSYQLIAARRSVSVRRGGLRLPTISSLGSS